jgi:hypothetical protein
VKREQVATLVLPESQALVATLVSKVRAVTRVKREQPDRAAILEQLELAATAALLDIQARRELLATAALVAARVPAATQVSVEHQDIQVTAVSLDTLVKLD